MSEPQPAAAQQVPPWWTDPTENVKVALESDRRRQDDLRNLQSAHDKELREADTRRQDEKAELRAWYDEKLRRAEAARIDAIREVDVRNQQIAAQVADTRANTLAGQVATTADAFRSAMAAELSPIKASIEDLRRAQYEAQGQKTQIVETRDTGTSTRATIMAVVMSMSVLIALVSVIAFVLKK